MILTKAVIRIRRNGKRWKQAFITLGKNIVDMMGCEQQEVLLLIINVDEQMPSSEEIKKSLEDYSSYLESKRNIEFMKKEVNVDGNTGERKTVEELFKQDR